jgi:hypothetical protein
LAFGLERAADAFHPHLRRETGPFEHLRHARRLEEVEVDVHRVTPPLAQVTAFLPTWNDRRR